SSYLGVPDDDQVSGITLDTSGNVYVTGDTFFPTGPATRQCDVFIAEFTAAGSQLLYFTYYGGSDNDLGLGIAADSAGNAYVTGSTASSNFSTVQPLQATAGGGSDAFVLKVNTQTGIVAYATYLGGGY